MRYLILALSLFALSGCYYATEDIGAAQLAPQEDITQPRSSSSVSYEMYSWYNGQDWAYALHETATGISSFADITNDPNTTVSTDNAIEALRLLPRGAKVYWNLKRIKGFSLPAQPVVDKVVSSAKKVGVTVEVIAWP